MDVISSPKSHKYQEVGGIPGIVVFVNINNSMKIRIAFLFYFHAVNPK